MQIVAGAKPSQWRATDKPPFIGDSNREMDSKLMTRRKAL